MLKVKEKGEFGVERNSKSRENFKKESKKIFVQWKQERLEYNQKWRTSKVLESLLQSEGKELNCAKSRLESEVNPKIFSMKRDIKGKRNLGRSFPKSLRCTIVALVALNCRKKLKISFGVHFRFLFDRFTLQKVPNFQKICRKKIVISKWNFCLCFFLRTCRVCLLLMNETKEVWRTCFSMCTRG